MEALPPQIRKSVRRFRQLYDVGLHGPELFRFPGALGAISASNVVKKYHGQSGKVFFERAGRMLRLHPSEGATAYLYGLLACYALRSLTEPYLSRQGGRRAAVEMEFDRYLLVMDKKGPPHLFDRSSHIRLTPGECGTVASFFPPASSGLVEGCTKTMADRIRALALPAGLRRQVLERSLESAGKDPAGVLMPTRGPALPPVSDGDLTRLFELAERRFAVLAEQMGAYLRRGTPLGADFSGEFF
jgi:hypothetical protein